MQRILLAALVFALHGCVVNPVPTPDPAAATEQPTVGLSQDGATSSSSGGASSGGFSSSSGASGGGENSDNGTDSAAQAPADTAAPPANDASDNRDDDGVAQPDAATPDSDGGNLAADTFNG